MIERIRKILKKQYSEIIAPLLFPGSKNYWEKRYASGKDSGGGSYGKLAEFKAEEINKFVTEHQIHSVIEYGCGDGNQLSLSNYESYYGFDVSETAINICKDRFSNDHTKHFGLMEEYNGEKAELSLSLDVIYHLIEDNVFENYMDRLFNTATKFVIIYSSDKRTSDFYASHVKPRCFTEWVKINKPEWQLIKYLPNKYPNCDDDNNGSEADFYFYELSASSVS